MTAAEVFKTLAANSALSRKLAAVLLEELHEAVEMGNLPAEEVGSMQFSIMPRPNEPAEEDTRKLSFILPDYFGPNAKRN